MKYTTTFLLIPILVSLLTPSYGQVSFTKVPMDRQLVGRDLSTNMGQIFIEGNVNNRTVDYESIQIDIYRDDLSINSLSQELSYAANVASFSFDFSIPAELANYSLKIYGKNEDILTLEREVTDIVAGDVYIIQGQSNAEAGRFNGDANIFQNDFIRVYAGGFDNSPSLLSNQQWFIGEGNGYRNIAGHIGQWGLKTAYSIVNSTNVPVAVFNGAHGGKRIDFFLATEDYQTSLASNYGRLYYRINQTNLKDYVRAVVWSQGETDATPSFRTTTEGYKNKFKDLRNSWLTDYSNIEHIYIFQTKNGCGQPIQELMKVKEAQRQLADDDSNISIISTAAMTHHTDACHFPLREGYEVFSDRLFSLINRDLYGATSLLDIDAPMIKSASLSDAVTLIVETDAITGLEIKTVAEDFLLSASNGATINGIAVDESRIVFTLSKNPGTNASISYLAHYFGSGNFITNANGLELISFNEFPISNSLPIPLKVEDSGVKEGKKVFPIPSANDIEVYGIEYGEYFEIYNVLGFKISTGNIPDHKKIDIEGLDDGMYFLKFKNGYTLKFLKE